MTEKKPQPKPLNINKLMLPAIGGIMGVLVIIILVTSTINVISGGTTNQATGGTVAISEVMPLKTVIDNIGDYISFDEKDQVILTTTGTIKDYMMQGPVFIGDLVSGLYTIELRGCFGIDIDNIPIGEYELTGKIKPKTEETTCLCEYRRDGETEYSSTSDLIIDGTPFHRFITMNNCYDKNNEVSGVEFRCNREYSYYYDKFYFECESHS